MKCGRCYKKISIKEWLCSCHKTFERGFCEKCEDIRDKRWVKEQIELIKEGKREIPSVI